MAAQAQNTSLVVTEQHPTIKPLTAPEILDAMDQYLIHSRLTARIILTDLRMLATESPKVLRCSTNSLFKCLLFAARHGKSFGKYGIEIMPMAVKEGDEEDAKKVLTAVPVLAYRSKIEAAKALGAIAVVAEVVLKGEKFEVHKDRGIITSIDHEIDYTARPLPTTGNVVCGWGVVISPKGEHFYLVLPRTDLDRAQKAAASKKGPWATDYEAQCRKTVQHRINEKYVVDFTAITGAAFGLEPVPADTESDPPLKVVNSEPDLATDLASRADHFKPTIIDRAKTMLEGCHVPADVTALKSTEEFKGLWKTATHEERGQIVFLGQERARDLEVQVQQAREANEQAVGATAVDPPQQPPPRGGVPPAGGAEAPPVPEETVGEVLAREDAEMEERMDPAGGGMSEPGKSVAATPETPADDSGAASAGFPDLPDDLISYETNAKRGGGGAALLEIIREFRSAWDKLGSNPDALVELVASSEQEWGRQMGSAEFAHYSTLKKTIREALGRAGLRNQL